MFTAATAEVPDIWGMQLRAQAFGHVLLEREFRQRLDSIRVRPNGCPLCPKRGK